MTSITFTYILVPVIGLGLALAMWPLLTHYALAWGLIDKPGVRKVHSKPVPLTGGTQIYLATTVVTLAALAVHHFISPDLSWERQVLTVLAGGTIVYLVGLLDDLLNIRSKYKLVVLMACSAALCGTGITLDGIHFGGQTAVEFGMFSWPMTMFWIATIAVAINFIDGLDGLAGGIVLIAVTVLAFLLMMNAAPSANTVMVLALAGALLAFLCHNRHPAKQFMGDSGSMYIGFMIGSATVIATHQVGTSRGLLLPGLALSVPLLDTAMTIFRRHFIQRRSIFAAERGHIHHRLIDMGLNHPNAVRVIHAVSVMAVGIGLLSLLASGWAALGVLAMCVPLLLGLFHISGSARGSTVLTAIKSKRQHDKELSTHRSTFDEMQLHFDKVKNFDQWWKATVDAAERLHFVWINMALRNRDGSERILRWNSVENQFNTCESLNAVIPIYQRRLGGPLRMEIEVAAPKSLESAGNRIAVFSRLMDDHAIASLPDNIETDTDWFEQSAMTNTDAPVIHTPPVEGLEQPRASKPTTIQHDDATPDQAQAQVNGPAPEKPQTPSYAQAKTSENKHAPDQAHPTPKPVLAEQRVAIVHDFLYTYAGAERVLEQIINLFPHADLFSLFDFLPENQRQFLQNKTVKTSFLQKMPLARKKHRAYLPLMPLAIEQFDLSSYDLVLSSSYLSAKGVITGPNQLHICYCHSPARYAWDLQHQYLDQSKLGYSPKGILARMILHYIRNWDARSAAGVDRFVSNSRFIAKRIEKLYRRDAQTIYPPVATDDFDLHVEKENYYVVASRLVPYKRIDLLVEAFNQMPGKQLVVIGDGPELAKIKALAGPNIRVLGHQPFKRMRRYFQTAKAFVFAAQEDFGIVPLEAMACGTPVIAYGQGGATETVRHGQTGILFRNQTVEDIVDAVRMFERTKIWPAERIRTHAQTFSIAKFHENLTNYIQRAWAEHKSQIELDAHLEIEPDQEDQRQGSIATTKINPIGKTLSDDADPAKKNNDQASSD